MGNATVRQTPAGQNLNQDHRIFMQVDLPKFVTHSKIGNGKFMKTYLMRVESTQVVVKVYMKFPDEDLTIAAKALTSLWNTIPPTKYPNLMPYQMWIRSTPKSKASPAPAYLIRQYFNANLYDRLSTRPFLNELEKYWIIFQLLKCLEICHEHGVVHGDIKPENVMCTTSNWIVLTDFSPFKPVMLPDDDLTDFKYFFDAMARDRCYIAQERFYRNHVDRWNKSVTQTTDAAKNTGKKTPTLNKPVDTKPQLLPSMDVFSAGCIMAEIMMDGTPLFDLPGMLQYVSSPLEMLANASTSQFGSNSSTPIPPTTPSNVNNNNSSQIEEISAKQLLGRIRNPQLKAVIASMTRKDADKRLSAADYLKILQGKIAVEQLTTDKPNDCNVIPEYFESCIYPLYLKLHWNGVTPDDRVMIVCESFGDIVQQVCHGLKDIDGARFFSSAKTDAPLVLASLLSLENRSHEVLLPAVGLEIACPSHPQTLCGLPLQHASSTAGVRVNGDQRHRTDAEHRALKEAKWPSSDFSEFWLSKGPVKNNNNGRVKVSEDSVLLLGVKEQRQLTAGQLLQRARAQLQDLELLQRGEDNWEQTFLDTSHVKAPVHGDTVDDRTSNGVNSDRSILEDQKRLQQSLAETLHQLQQSLHHSSQHNDGFFSPPPKQPTVDVDIGDNDIVHGHDGDSDTDRARYEGLVLIVDIICANYRHLKLLSSRALSLLLLGRLGALCTDAVILQRIVPVLLIATEDAAPQVRVLALRCLSALTSLVRHIEPIEVGFFPQYVFSALSRLAKDQELLVKLAFAQCLGTIACTAKRFLVLGHRLHADKILREQSNSSGMNNTGINNTNAFSDSTAVDVQATSTSNIPPTTSAQPHWPANAVLDFPYDSKLEQLKEQVSRWIRDLVLDPASVGFGMSTMYAYKIPQNNSFSSNSANGMVQTHASPETSVKKVLLTHVLELSDFFGQESTMDKLLTQLLTFLNDQDSELRELFCRQVSRLGLLLGLSVTSEYIVPCLENVLYDVEEKVAVAAVESLAALVSAGLVAHYWLLDFCHKASALLLHPSVGLRSAGIAFFSTAARAFGVLDTAVLLLPALRPFLADEVTKTCCCTLSSGIRSFSRQSSDSEDKDNDDNTKDKTITNKAPSPDVNDTPAMGGSTAASLSLAEAIQQPAQLRLALKAPLQAHNLHMALRKQLLSISVQHNANSSNVEELNALNETQQDTVVLQKLSLMQSYLTHTAREVYTKSLRWRHAASSQLQQLMPNNSSSGNNNNSIAALTTSSGRRPTFPSTSVSSTSNSNNNSVNNNNKTLGVLQWSVTHATLLDSHYHSNNNSNSNNNNGVQAMSHVMSLAVPTMRAGVSVSEDLRRQHIYLDNDEERNLRKLRMLFLAYPVSNNATTNASNNNTVENSETYYDNLVQNEYYGSGNSASGSNNNTLGAGANVAGSPDAYENSTNTNSGSVKRHYYYGGNNDSVTLLRRLRGLQVPPVCIDLGTPLATNEELKLLQDTNTLLSLGIFSAVNVNSAATGGGINSLNNANNINPALNNNLAGLSIALNNANLDVLDAASQQQLQQQLQLQVALYNLNNNNNNSNVNNMALNNGNNVNFAVAAAAGAVSGMADPSLTASATAVSGMNSNNVGNVNAGVANNSNPNNFNIGGGRKEREGVLLMTLREHSAAVHRLVVSSDMSYFCSASADGTVKVWQTRLLDRVAFPRSAGTYAGHKGPVLDAVAVEQSHSVCSASKDGTVHVWRVDLSVSPNNSTSVATGNANNTYGAYVQPSGASDTNNINTLNNNNTNSSISTSNSSNNHLNDFHFLHPNASYAYASVRGASLLRVLNPDEGAVTAVQHFNSEVASVVLFGSQRGVVHAWDLRMSREAFTMTLRPEMGSLSALTVGPDRHWVAAGTTKGVVALWDVRFNVLSAAWRHSSGSAIQRLACCKAPRSVVPGLGYTEGVFLFCAAGNNEAAIFGLPEGGECAKCFRSVPMNESRAPVLSLPSLQSLHLAQLHNPHLLSQPYNSYLTGNNPANPSHIVRAMLGRVSPNNPSHLVTAGSDRCIRFWDFQQPSQCFTIAGSEPTQPRAQFRAVKTETAASLGSGVVAEYPVTPATLATFTSAPNLIAPTTTTTNKLLVCYTSALPSPDKILQSQLPVRENRGLSTPSVNNRDGILDLKDIELPQRLLLSSARDGEIKMWKVLL